MKDSEFIELLNLYLDHEISVADAARIETEVQQNPARRRVYQEYCRLQKACTLLAKDYVDQAATTDATEDRKLVAFEPRRSWGLGVYAGGLAVAAACVAMFVIAKRSGNAGSVENSTNAVAALAPTMPAPVEVKVQPALVDNSKVRTIAQTVTVAAQRTEARPVFTTGSLTLSKGNSDGTLVAADQQRALDARFEWISSMQLAPVQRNPADDLRFDSNAGLKRDPRTYGPGRLQSDVQNAAFQFQR